MTVTSIHGLIAENKKIAKRYERYTLYYRGARAGDPLVPKIGEPYNFAGRRSYIFDLHDEVNLLHRFRRRVHRFTGRVLSEWETIVMARHFALPVRIMDWTRNPLVALYFAAFSTKPPPKTRSTEADDGIIWVLARKDEDDTFLDVFDDESAVPKELLHNREATLPKSIRSRLRKNKRRLTLNRLPLPLRVRGVKMIYPVDNTHRLVAQSGLFTIQDDPWEDLSILVKRFAARKPNSPCCDLVACESMVVPEKARWTLLTELERMGISQGMLFPDEEGIAKGLCHSIILNAGK